MRTDDLQSPDARKQARGKAASLRVLLAYISPYRWHVAGAAVSLLVSSGLLLVLGQGLKRLIDRGFADGSMTQLNHTALAMGAIVTVMGTASATRFYLVSRLGERVAADLRRDAFNRILSLSPEFFETARTGELLSRLTADVTVLQTLVGSSLSQWLRNALGLCGAFALLMVTSVKLAAVVLLVVPMVLVPVILLGRRERVMSRASQDRIADLGAYAEETLNALRTVQSFTHEPVDRARFSRTVEASVATALRRVRARSLLLLCVIVLGFGAITFSLWVGGRDVIEGRMTGGDLSAFVFYAVIVATSGAALSELLGDMQRAAGAATRLMELLSERAAISSPDHPVAFPRPVRGRIDFDQVIFRYPARPDTSALDGFTVSIAAGETVALVGPSGAGKTTVFQLLQRFYDPLSGSILIDGVDIATADLAALRGLIGVVPQDPVVFSANAWENIRYGRPDATDNEVRAAAEAASADFLDDLPEGFETFLGEKGVRLSGGQRQRIAIARAILRNPPILLLDEATSALDAESERAVQHALATLARGRTTLVVAHRLATVRRADRILVMEQGRLVASGTHDSLVRDGGLYGRFAALQFTGLDGHAPQAQLQPG